MNYAAKLIIIIIDHGAIQKGIVTAKLIITFNLLQYTGKYLLAEIILMLYN